MKNLAILSVLVCVAAGCNSNQGYSGSQGQKAIKCAENWESQGYNFDPNSMTCWQMFLKVMAIRRAEYWKDKGYDLDPNSMTSEEMDEQAKHIDRARYWKEHGYDFDPYAITANEMDNKAAINDVVKQVDFPKIRVTQKSLTSSYPKNYYRSPLTSENGSYYGQMSEVTGRPKTVHVRGYYRKDGTYVRSYYRSPPRR